MLIHSLLLIISQLCEAVSKRQLSHHHDSFTFYQLKVSYAIKLIVPTQTCNQIIFYQLIGKVDDFLCSHSHTTLIPNENSEVILNSP